MKHTWTVNGAGTYTSEQHATNVARSLADEQDATVIVARDDDVISVEVIPSRLRQEAEAIALSDQDERDIYDEIDAE